MGRHKRIYTQQEIEVAVDLVRKGGTYEEVSRRMEVIFHKKFSPSQLNVQVRQAQGLMPTETSTPHLNRFTPPRPRLLPDFSAREQQLLPGLVNAEIEVVKEDPVTEFLNHLAPTDGLQYVKESSLPFPTPPRIENFPSMLSSAMNDVVNSLPVIAVNSWKSRMMNSMWRKFNPPIPSEEEFPHEDKTEKKNEILELKRMLEESQKEDKNMTSLGNHCTAGGSVEFVSPPDNGPVKPSMDGLVCLSTTPPQPTSAITAEPSEQKKSETEVAKATEPLVVPSSRTGSGPDADALKGPKTPKSPIEFETEGLLKPDAKAAVMTSQPPTAILTAQPPPPIETSSVLVDSSGEGQLLHGTSKPATVIQPPTIETPVVPADSKGESQSFNRASNPQIADHTVQLSITQDTCSTVQPTIIRSIDAPNPSIAAEVKEVKQEINNPETSFRQNEPGAIPNRNGNVFQKAIWITASVGILGLAIYIFNPQLRGWIFSHFTRFIQASQQQSQRLAVPDQSRASQPAEVPTLYSVLIQSISQTSLHPAQGYSRVNDPNGPATF